MSQDTSRSRFRELARNGGLVPVVREFSADTLTPVAAYTSLTRPPFGFLLESLIGGERWARYTYLGTEPRAAVRYRDGAAERWTAAGGWRPAGHAPDPLAHIAALVRERRPVEVAGLPRFLGGAIGFISYDLVRTLERLPHPPADDLDFPDAVFVLVDQLVIIDNLLARALVVANADVPEGASESVIDERYTDAMDGIGELVQRLQSPRSLTPLSLDVAAPDLDQSSPYSRETFERDVARIKDYIRAGDVFQVVLSRRQDVPFTGNPFDVYRALRTLNPAPYLYYLDLDGFQLAGSSPEVLVRVEGDEVTVRPIAGTRPRGADAADDAALTHELLSDPKELAEHAMLVDLGRNDIGRVARFGTVRVSADKVIERYSHVQHIVSQVDGILAPDQDAVAALRACFPAGTVSGAPKVRAMEIIDELEPTRRGPYAGAVCYLGWGGGTMDAAITIRTAVLEPGRAYVQAGAGIVADSVPSREFEETQHKANAVLRALALADRSRTREAAGILSPLENPQ